jgi:hypothetical protein
MCDQKSLPAAEQFKVVMGHAFQIFAMRDSSFHLNEAFDSGVYVAPARSLQSRIKRLYEAGLNVWT